MNDDERCVHGRSLSSRRDNPCPTGHPSCSTKLGDTLSLLRERAHLEAQAALRAADVHTLLTKAYALTHRMHVGRNTDEAYANSAPGSPMRVAIDDLRAQRDLITAEIERRTVLAMECTHEHGGQTDRAACQQRLVARLRS